MPLYPILLIAVILARDHELAAGSAGSSDALALWMAIGPVIAVLAMAQLGTWWCRRRLDATASPSMLIAAERVSRAARAFIIANHVIAVLMLGWAEWVRARVGNLVLVDEILMIAPAVLGLSATWWVFYPVESRARQALLMRSLDEGRPVHPIPSRGAYVRLQTRLHLLFMLVPLLLIAGMHELVIILAGRWQVFEGLPEWTLEATLFASTLLVFLIAPLLARLVLDVRPLAAGELRDELQRVCDVHRVKVRKLLVWNTSGMMMNAAVMGLVGPLRYVLITDALLETMTLPQLRGVMAHEVAHIRKHHMFWLLAALIAAVVVGVVATWPVFVLMAWQDVPEWVYMTAAGAQLLIALLIFGWVSRRFERQADTFAARHLSGNQPLVTAEAVSVMRDALGTIATLNSIPYRRRSWRHGSISWRRKYLATLVDRPVERLPIDRLVVGIKIGAAIVIILMILAAVLMPDL